MLALLFGFSLAGQAVAQTIADVEDMSVREYNELGAFVRAEIMEPVAEKAGVRYLDLNACLKASADHPILRRETVKAAVAGCVEWAKEKNTKPN